MGGDAVSGIVVSASSARDAYTLFRFGKLVLLTAPVGTVLVTDGCGSSETSSLSDCVGAANDFLAMIDFRGESDLRGRILKAKRGKF